MDFQRWNTPIWSDQRNFLEFRKTGCSYAYPDWGNAGSSVVETWADTPKHETPLMSRQRSYQRQKDIEAKCPLEKGLQFAYPLLRPRRMYSAEKDGGGVLRRNCLEVLQMEGQTFVVHLGWNVEQQNVMASRLKEGAYYGEGEDDAAFFKLKKCARFPRNEVSQIVAKEVNDVGYVLLRSKRDAQLLTLQGGGFVSTACDTFNRSVTTDGALSDALPGLWALACADGEVFLKNAKGEDFLWRGSFQGAKNGVSLYHCDFGKHPLSLIVGSESSIWACDTRIGAKGSRNGQPVNGSAVRTVLEAQEMRKHFFTFEEICSFSHIDRLPYLYVATADSVYVMDERYCKMPVISWKHMLMKRPSYTCTQKFGDMEFLMLANSHGKKVSVIANEWFTNGYNTWCRGVSLPKHYLIAEDTMNVAHRQDLWFRHQVQERLESSWAGVASLVHPSNSSSMLFLSSYINGDIFLQEFKVSRGHGKGLPLDTPAKSTQCGKEILSRWEEDTVRVSLSKSLSDNVTYFDASDFYQRIVSKNISEEMGKMFNDLPLPFTDDPSNGGTDHAEAERADARNRNDIWCIRDLVLRHRKHKKKRRAQKTSGQSNRPNHWLDALIDNYIVDYVGVQKDLPLPGSLEDSGNILDEVLPRKISSFLKMENLKNCKDYLAPRILSLWKVGEGSCSSSSELGHSSSKPAFQYHTAPIDVSQLLSLPSKLQPEADHTSVEVADLNFEDLSQCSQPSQDTSRFSLDTSQISQNTPLSKRKSKTAMKGKLKKKRLDGF